MRIVVIVVVVVVVVVVVDDDDLVVVVVVDHNSYLFQRCNGNSSCLRCHTKGNSRSQQHSNLA